MRQPVSGEKHDPGRNAFVVHYAGDGRGALLRESFDLLRREWGEVPGGEWNRVCSRELLSLPAQDLLDRWSVFHAGSTSGEALAVRGCYQLSRTGTSSTARGFWMAVAAFGDAFR
ncbi:MAG: hypothetical protein ACE141_05435 [Bryobacteraceae bacterium]